MARDAKKYLKKQYHIENLALEVTLHNMEKNPFSGKNESYCSSICPNSDENVVFTVF